MKESKSAYRYLLDFRRMVDLFSSADSIERTLETANEHRARGEWAAAAEGYKTVVALDDTLTGIWVQLGHALKESGDFDGARLAYQKATASEPENAEYYLHLGHLLKNMGHFEEAVAVFFQCLQCDPEIHDAYDQLLHLGCTREEILSAVPAFEQMRSSKGLSGEKLPTALMFEVIRQLTACGNQPHKSSSFGS